MAKIVTLTEMLDREPLPALQDGIAFSDLNKYVIELMRISTMYKFRIHVKPGRKPKPKLQEQREIKESMDRQTQDTVLKGIEEETPKEYLNVKQDLSDVKVGYQNKKNSVVYAHYGAKSKGRYQELWEKTGFYQERTTQAKVRVQLWPEHLPYDHFKRKRAFLFC